MRRLLPLALAVVLLTVACAGDDGGEDDPGAVVESYIDAYNDGDFDAVMTHFVVESTITGHPTDSDPVAPDIYSIRTIHKADLAFGEQYVISNLSVEGDTVTWNSVWGDDGCVQGHSTVVEDGKMLSWMWGEFVDCSDLG